MNASLRLVGWVALAASVSACSGEKLDTTDTVAQIEDGDNDGYALTNDCDDASANINPSVDEVPYDGLDNDCDPSTADDDLDGDGHLLADDCDEANAAVNPDVDEEPYDGLDNDCDPTTADDNLDNDGYLLADDCDDGDADINPSVDEVPYDGLDNDCAPATADDDLDGDGYVLADDCDHRGTHGPGRAELSDGGGRRPVHPGQRCVGVAVGPRQRHIGRWDHRPVEQ